jgi:hypothetical protein
VGPPAGESDGAGHGGPRMVSVSSLPIGGMSDLTLSYGGVDIPGVWGTVGGGIGILINWLRSLQQDFVRITSTPARIARLSETSPYTVDVMSTSFYNSFNGLAHGGRGPRPYLEVTRRRCDDRHLVTSGWPVSRMASEDTRQGPKPRGRGRTAALCWAAACTESAAHGIPSGAAAVADDSYRRR